MTRKDYELIASAFNQYEGTKDSMKEIAEILSNLLEKENKLFNKQKFLRACGIK